MRKEHVQRSKAVYFGCHHVTEHGSHLGGAWRADGDCIEFWKEMRGDAGKKLKKKKRKILASHGINFGLYSTRWKL